jgi:MFS family permease
VAAAPLYGLFMGGFGALYILVVQESFGMRHYGSVMGLMNLGTVVSFGLGPLIAGASYDFTGGYGTAFLIVCGLFVAGAVSLILAGPRIPKADTAPRRSS